MNAAGPAREVALRNWRRGFWCGFSCGSITTLIALPALLALLIWTGVVQ